jgi:hypothetical protein
MLDNAPVCTVPPAPLQRSHHSVSGQFPSVRRYVLSPVAYIAHSASFITVLGAAAGRTSTVLIKDRPQIHFQRRVCDPEDISLELAETFALGDGIGAL